MTNLTKKEKTQQMIMHTAISLFASRGYNATATSHIAKEAHVSEAIIFKYYKNKENLLKEICSVAMKQIVENISIIPLLKNVEKSKAYPLKDFIHAILQERLEFLYKNHELIKLLLLEMQYSADLKNQARNLVFPKAYEVFKFIQAIIAEKAGIPNERAGAVMRILVGIIGSVWFQKYLLELEITNEEISKDVDEILSVIQKGICK